MDFTNKKFLLPGAAVVVLLIIAFAASRSGKEASAPLPGQPEEKGSEVPSPQTPSVSAPAPAPNAPQPSQPAPKPAPPISSQAPAILSPDSGSEWVIGQNHEIRWSKAIGRNGEIYLIDAATKSVVGWILSSIGVNQTSYAWDTKEVYLSRTNPSKKEIAAGTYVIKIRFDGPVPETQSPQFSVIYSHEAKIPTKAVSIENAALVPSTITAKKGDIVVFTNKDAVTYQIQIANISPPYSVAPGASFSFNTAVFNPGPYLISSAAYSSLRGTLVVQ
ncbi:hypothetical protein C4587_01455 [Candidatus Parcubacteria bacterium]|nr:MAG: hypothetical protein C4587_01455 [Candidatus Parcubacteria bacterium]